MEAENVKRDTEIIDPEPSLPSTDNQHTEPIASAGNVPEVSANPDTEPMNVDSKNSELELLIDNAVLQQEIPPYLGPVLASLTTFLQAAHGRLTTLSKTVRKISANVDERLAGQRVEYGKISHSIFELGHILKPERFPKAGLWDLVGWRVSAKILDLQHKLHSEAEFLYNQNFLSPLHTSPLRVGDYMFDSLIGATFQLCFDRQNRPDVAFAIRKIEEPIDVLKFVTESDLIQPDAEPELKKIMMLMFHVKASQWQQFHNAAQKLKSSIEDGKIKKVYNITPDDILGVGLNLFDLQCRQPESYPGKNLYGQWLAEFVLSMESESDQHEADLAEIAKKYEFENLSLPKDKSRILMIGDTILAGFTRFRGGTKIAYSGRMKFVQDQYWKHQTMSNIIEESSDFIATKCAAVVIFSPRADVFVQSFDPEKHESRILEVLQLIRSKSQDVAIVLGSTIPYTNNKYKEAALLASYAEKLAVRNFGDKNLMFLDLYCSFDTVQEDWSKAIPDNVLTQNPAARDHLIEIFLQKLPFVQFANRLAERAKKKPPSIVSDSKELLKDPSPATAEDHPADYTVDSSLKPGDEVISGVLKVSRSVMKKRAKRKAAAVALGETPYPFMSKPAPIPPKRAWRPFNPGPYSWPAGPDPGFYRPFGPGPGFAPRMAGPRPSYYDGFMAMSIDSDPTTRRMANQGMSITQMAANLAERCISAPSTHTDATLCQITAEMAANMEGAYGASPGLAGYGRPPGLDHDLPRPRMSGITSSRSDLGPSIGADTSWASALSPGLPGYGAPLTAQQGSYKALPAPAKCPKGKGGPFPRSMMDMYTTSANAEVQPQKYTENDSFEELIKF